MQEQLEDIKEVSGSRKSKTERQHNGRKKKYKTTHNDLQITTETKYWGRETPSKTVMNSSSGTPEG
jgi:hypothetical protein